MSQSVQQHGPVQLLANEALHPASWQRDSDMQTGPLNAVPAGMVPDAADLAARTPHSNLQNPELTRSVPPLWQAPHASTAAAAATTAAAAAAATMPGAQPVFVSSLYHASGYPHPYAAISSPQYFFPTTTQYTRASAHAAPTAMLTMAGDAQSRPPLEDDSTLQLQRTQQHVLDSLGTETYARLRSVLMAQQLEYRCQVHILQWLLLQHSVLEAQMSSSGTPSVSSSMTSQTWCVHDVAR
jgi:hypothetical protein